MAANGTTKDATQEQASLQALFLARKAELEAQLRALDTIDIEALLREREEAAARLAELDGRIAQVRAQLGATQVRRTPPAIADGSAASSRQRMSSDEVRRRIAQVLAEDKEGLSQLEIAARTALAYGTVAAYLKTNAAQFRIAGHLKHKRYFLK